MIRAVLDTNQFVSSLVARAGVQGRILSAWAAGEFQLAASPAIIEEIARVLTYPKIAARYGILPGEITKLIQLIQHQALIVPGAAPIAVIDDDASDNAILACALEAEADVIVSGDAHLLKLGAFRGIPIVTGQKFLDMLETA